MRIPGWAKALAIGAGLAVGAALAASQYVAVSVNEYYSRGWRSQSAADAARKGALIARLPVETPRVQYPGGSIDIREAWVEQATRLRYRLYLIPRLELEPRYRLVIAYRVHGQPASGCTAFFANDSTWLGGDGSAFEDASLRPGAFPAAVRITAQVRPHCEARTDAR